MRGYLAVTGTDMGALLVESRIGIYRNPEGSHAVCARTDGKEHDLGVSDATVSRLQNDTPPVVIEPKQSSIEIHNKQNTNGVTVVCDGERTELEEGITTRVTDTAVITIGYQTKLRLTVEREAKTEINVGGDVTGEVVAGDKRSVDERTQVVDSVVNRSDIGGESRAEVEDSVVNRSRVGESSQQDSADNSDTQKHCETHDRMYTREACPECEAEASSGETKFCIFCGIKIPAVAAVCPECGEQFPD